ncbi:MAG: LysR substrate-binding domain-containing protein [Deltaproteobacteria bacterium]
MPYEMPPDLARRLEILVLVARALSDPGIPDAYPYAAQQLGLDPSTINRALSELARWFGGDDSAVPLVTGRGEGKRLTPQGRRAVAFATQILDQIATFRAELLGDAHAVSIGATSLSFANLLPAAVAQYRADYDDAHTQITIRRSRSAIIREEIRTGVVDFALMRDTAAPEGFEADVFADDALHLVVHEGHPLEGLDTAAMSSTKAREDALRQIAEQPLGLYIHSGTHARLREALKPYAPRVTHQTTNRSVLLDLVRRRLCVSVVSLVAASNNELSGITTVDVSGLFEPTKIWVVWRHRDVLSQTAARLKLILEKQRGAALR